METHCSDCKAAMTCKPEGGCWCMELPRVPMPSESSSCLCTKCLQEKIEAELKANSSVNTPTPSPNAAR